MNENRRQILEMLSTGKITADEAERLIAAMEKERSSGSESNGIEPRPKARPKYIRVVVDDNGTGTGPLGIQTRRRLFELASRGVRASLHGD